MSEQGPTPSVGVMLGAAGPCPEIRLGKQLWKVGHPTEAARAELERLVIQAASAEVLSLKGDLPPAAYAEMLSNFTRAVSAKAYKTWGDGWTEVVSKPENAHLFLLALLRENHPGATAEDSLALLERCPDEVAIAYAQVLPDFIRLLLLTRKDLTPGQREEATGRFVGGFNKLLARRQPPPSDASPSTAPATAT